MMTNLPKHPEPKLIRETDGSLWEASWNPAEGWAIGLFNDSKLYFFRRLEPNPARRWWAFWRPRYRRTGETWEGGLISDGGFHLRAAP